MSRRSTGETGQAAVESAIIIPTMIFALLGALQLTMAYHARILAEYAAFKAVRAGSVYRAHCGKMKEAALTALIPTLDYKGGSGLNSNSQDYEHRFNVVAASDQVRHNRSRVGTPVVVIRRRLDPPNRSRSFDEMLSPGDEVRTQLHVELTYFYHYRVPFADWLLSRWWLAMHKGTQFVKGNDPLLPTHKAGHPPKGEWRNVWKYAAIAINQRYYTVPITTSWSMRMMSAPLPGGFPETCPP